VVPAEEHALKIEAAREAIGDADFFLVARTDARATSGLKEAISRANLYWEVWHANWQTFLLEMLNRIFLENLLL